MVARRLMVSQLMRGAQPHRPEGRAAATRAGARPGERRLDTPRRWRGCARRSLRTSSRRASCVGEGVIGAAPRAHLLPGAGAVRPAPGQAARALAKGLRALLLREGAWKPGRRDPRRILQDGKTWETPRPADPPKLAASASRRPIAGRRGCVVSRSTTRAVSCTDRSVRRSVRWSAGPQPGGGSS
jgi:hypothetical protein